MELPDVRGLAWDDKPEDYMLKLQRRLAPLGIGLEVLSDYAKFAQAFDQNQSLYDFVILDLFDENHVESKDTGKKLAEYVARKVSHKPWYPIFIVTAQLSRLQPEHMDHTLPANAVVRYKADAVFLAQLIKEDLIRRGVFTSRRKVFLIRSTVGDRAKKVDELRNWLKEPPWRLEVVEVTPGTLGTELASGLLRKMNECAGIVAFCTPDELLQDKVYRSRPNVILEIGMALALPRGLERLVIVKQKDVERPSDIGGLVSIDYADDPSDKFAELEQRLIVAGVNMKGEGR